MMLLVVLAVVLVAVAQANKDWVKMEPSVNVFASSQWIREPSISDGLNVVAHFVLKTNPTARKAFEKQLLELSTPSNAKYGQWLSKDQVKAQLAPSEGSVKKVVDFAKSYGLTDENIKIGGIGGLTIRVSMPVKTANDMFQTEFGVFRSVLNNKAVLPRIIKPYYLPSNIADVVSLVDDIMRFPSIRKPLLSVDGPLDDKLSSDDPFAACGTKCNGFTTPAVLEQAYKFSKVTSATKGNSVSVAEFQYQYYDNKDLKAFSDACDVEVSVADTIGGNKESICEAGGCTEALLDIEYLGAITNPIPQTVIYSGTYSLLDWVNGLMAMDEPTLVNSVSYGNDEVQQTSVEYMESCNTQFMAAGSMGLSILFASGDQGVWGRSGVGSTYHPDFPAASPYVTAVGGTNFKTKSTVGEESAWNCGGGGFSDTFARPEWQSDVVDAYLTNAKKQGVLPDESLFNSTGRAYPDVSALGGQTNPYCIAVRGGSFGGVAGTSASCPVVAGIFAQMNNVRLAAGKAPLGYLNPLIYANPQCFNDVNDGSQNNCNKGTQGFAAINGWDAATGFGSPNYECLSKL